MSDIEIIEQLLTGRHLDDSEIQRARVLLVQLTVSLASRVVK